MIYVIGDVTLISDIEFDRVIELKYTVEANKYDVLNIKASLKPTDAFSKNYYGSFIDVVGSGSLLFKGFNNRVQSPPVFRFPNNRNNMP